MRLQWILWIFVACNNEKPPETDDTTDTDGPSDTDVVADDTDVVADDTDVAADDTDVAADDTDVAADDTDPPVGDQPWCDVQTILLANCYACHDETSLGGLSFVPDPWAALVNAPSVWDPAVHLVEPGSPGASLLYQKLLGTQTLGAAMPPGASLSADDIEVVRLWIASGAPDDCGAVDTDVPPASYHPAGYDDPAQHGMEAKYQVQTCVQCHGQDLTGTGNAVSCDDCHAPGWRTDCTFCHGDPAEGTGAPPVHISGLDDGANATFIPHLAHVSQTDVHRPFDCVECHVKPADVLSPGHLFLGDATPGLAEAVFTAGISSTAAWNGNGTCNNLWCHGNGRGDNGRLQHTANVGRCSDCHADRSSGFLAWTRMSGEHGAHLSEGLQCWECHGSTVDDQMNVLDFDLHINRTADIQLRQGMTFNGRCSGTCHGEVHNNRSW
jgi:hypothetical protein